MAARDHQAPRLLSGYYYNHHKGEDCNLGDQFRGRAAFEKTVDPNYETLPLAEFEPVVRRVFARTPSTAEGPPRESKCTQARTKRTRDLELSLLEEW
ncbi:hypothetical protein ABH999_000685 [Bradyrhizobium yuanmingense]|uniref:hypothetical protein n=1 Tax=Bradyrhizobium yuanmingense TaxID=108015 RepID=UPI0035194DE1